MERTEFTLARNGNPKSLPATRLKPIPRVWFNFIIGSFLPSVNDSEVFIEKANLLFGIMYGLHINVGAIISEHIHRVAQSRGAAPLPYPSLISLLCLAAGVEPDESDAPVHPKKPLDDTRIERIHDTFDEKERKEVEYQWNHGHFPPPPPSRDPNRAGPSKSKKGKKAAEAATESSITADHLKIIFEHIRFLDSKIDRLAQLLVPNLPADFTSAQPLRNPFSPGAGPSAPETQQASPSVQPHHDPSMATDPSPWAADFRAPTQAATAGPSGQGKDAVLATNASPAEDDIHEEDNIQEQETAQAEDDDAAADDQESTEYNSALGY